MKIEERRVQEITRNKHNSTGVISVHFCQTVNIQNQFGKLIPISVPK